MKDGAYPLLFPYSHGTLVCSCFSSRANKGEGLVFPEQGSVLVFLPGINEIRVMKEALAKLVHKR